MYFPYNNDRLGPRCVRGNVHVSLWNVLTIMVHFYQLVVLIASAIMKKAPAFTDAFQVFTS